MREKPIYLDPFFLFIYFLVTGRKEARTQRERGTEKGAPRSILLYVFFFFPVSLTSREHSAGCF